MPSKEDYINPHFTNKKKKFEQNIQVYSITNSRLSQLYKKDRQCACKCNTEARSRNHLHRGNEISIILSGSAYVALVIQHEKDVLVMMRVFWNFKLCRLANSYRTFEGV